MNNLDRFTAVDMHIHCIVERQRCCELAQALKFKSSYMYKPNPETLGDRKYFFNAQGSLAVSFSTEFQCGSIREWLKGDPLCSPAWL